MSSPSIRRINDVSSVTSASSLMMGSQQQKEALDPQVVMAQMSSATPDTNVQLFLEAAGRACVHIENWYRQRSELLQEKEALTKDHESFQQNRVSEVVHLFRGDRPRLEQEVTTLRAEKQEIVDGKNADLKKFRLDSASEKVKFEANLSTINKKIEELSRDATEAEDWFHIQGPPARKQLQDLHARIEEINETTDEKLKRMQEAHEDSKRQMRENLVLRLRAVRDAAAADAAAAGDGSAEDENAVLIGKPTTKTNERLTREVAVYVRESLALEHSLTNLRQQEDTLARELSQKQLGHEKMILQNAASTKTKRVLQGKLNELQQQLGQVEKDAEQRLEERSNSLVATSQQQGQIIESLNDEIDNEIDKLLLLKADLREAQSERLVQQRKSRASARFFVNCLSEFTPPDASSGDGEKEKEKVISKEEEDKKAYSAFQEEGEQPERKEQQQDRTTTTTTTTQKNKKKKRGEFGDFVLGSSRKHKEKENEEENLTLFLPSTAVTTTQQKMVSSNQFSGIGKVSGRKEAAQVLMRILQVSN